MALKCARRSFLACVSQRRLTPSTREHPGKLRGREPRASGSHVAAVPSLDANDRRGIDGSNLGRAEGCDSIGTHRSYATVGQSRYASHVPSAHAVRRERSALSTERCGLVDIERGARGRLHEVRLVAREPPECLWLQRCSTRCRQASQIQRSDVAEALRLESATDQRSSSAARVGQLSLRESRAGLRRNRSQLRRAHRKERRGIQCRERRGVEMSPVDVQHSSGSSGSGGSGREADCDIIRAAA